MKYQIRIKTESKYMKVCLMQFDRLLHQSKIFFNEVAEEWQFIAKQEFHDLQINNFKNLST